MFGSNFFKGDMGMGGDGGMEGYGLQTTGCSFFGG